MTAILEAERPEAAARWGPFLALAARETRRFAINPVFLLAVGMIAFSPWYGAGSTTSEIDTLNPYPAIFFGGLGMMAAFWLTRSTHPSAPVLDVTPTTLPARTAAVGTVAVLPLLGGVVALLAFLHLHPVGSPLYGAFSPAAQVAVLVGQMVMPSLGGPLLGLALGRWVRFPGTAFLAFLLLYGWVTLVTVLSMSHPNSTFVAVLRLFSPFAFFTYTANGGRPDTWRGSPWFFIGWQLALCAIAVLVAVLYGADGRARTRIVRALTVAAAAAVVLLGLAVAGGFTHAGTA